MIPYKDQLSSERLKVALCAYQWKTPTRNVKKFEKKPDQKTEY